MKIVVILLAQLYFAFAASISDCSSVVKSDSHFNGICSASWSNLKPLLKPTQLEVGFAWIKYKLDNKFTTATKAQKEMDAGATPAVLGPDNFIYVIDDHHTLCSLDYSGFDCSVSVNIICDLRKMTMAEFWQYMDTTHKVYLGAHPSNDSNALPIPISPNDLPSQFSFTKSLISFRDDPWRSLAGYSRKVTVAAKPAPSCPSTSENCERCFFRGCVDGYETKGPGVPFFEFRWAYFMNLVTFFDVSYWPSKKDYDAFKAAYIALPQSNVEASNPDDWIEAASLIISLCRAESTGAYLLPEDVFHIASYKLPGYTSGYELLDDDPSCDSPIC